MAACVGALFPEQGAHSHGDWERDYISHLCYIFSHIALRVWHLANTEDPFEFSLLEFSS
jgi:hypothetical protein